ncbi:hypothetical protein B0H15DRAFT_954603 [Mycena belliarum]|uniref:Uncharacterized protein n=1 Tax=Mycena belliarum TaxID=1033014 RepID=A0AAD6TUY5_9AGAR|nr:hypothetical protein B0H15DRAFT_954603 [Mycena belliae]
MSTLSEPPPDSPPDSISARVQPPTRATPSLRHSYAARYSTLAIHWHLATFPPRPAPTPTPDAEGTICSADHAASSFQKPCAPDTTRAPSSPLPLARGLHSTLVSYVPGRLARPSGRRPPQRRPRGFVALLRSKCPLRNRRRPALLSSASPSIIATRDSKAPEDCSTPRQRQRRLNPLLTDESKPLESSARRARSRSPLTTSDTVSTSGSSAERCPPDSRKRGRAAAARALVRPSPRRRRQRSAQAANVTLHPTHRPPPRHPPSYGASRILAPPTRSRGADVHTPRRPPCQLRAVANRRDAREAPLASVRRPPARPAASRRRATDRASAERPASPPRGRPRPASPTGPSSRPVCPSQARALRSRRLELGNCRRHPAPLSTRLCSPCLIGLALNTSILSFALRDRKEGDQLLVDDASVRENARTSWGGELSARLFMCV